MFPGRTQRRDLLSPQEKSPLRKEGKRGTRSAHRPGVTEARLKREALS